MTVILGRGDAACLPLADNSADLIVTSPPYFGLRDYRDGDESLDGQIGAEATPGDYIDALIECTREWVRVLKPTGSMFVNLGDKYANDTKWGGATSGKHVAGLHGKTGIGRAKMNTGFPAKSLMCLPQRYMLACLDELGLTVRAEIIWNKPNGLPESQTDRVRQSHEKILHLVLQPHYYTAVDEIREEHISAVIPGRRHGGAAFGAAAKTGSADGTRHTDGHPLGKLPGSVWTIPTQPLFVPDRIAHARCCAGRKRPGCEDGLGHHAAFPMELPRRCILGWSPPGICTACGEGRRPVSETGDEYRQERDRVNASRLRTEREAALAPAGRTNVGGFSKLSNGVVSTERRITGYACACPTPDAPTRPALVVDPFGGTGTTALVAAMYGRTGASFDRSAGYCGLAAWRTTDPAERAKALQVRKPPPVPSGQLGMFDEAAS